MEYMGTCSFLCRLLNTGNTSEWKKIQSFICFVGMPPAIPPTSLPPPGHPVAPAPHVNPAFFPPPHGAPPPAVAVSIIGKMSTSG